MLYGGTNDCIWIVEGPRRLVKKTGSLRWAVKAATNNMEKAGKAAWAEGPMARPTRELLMHVVWIENRAEPGGGSARL